MTNFQSFAISPDRVKILQRLQIVVPTPIQVQTIPIGLSGRDVIGIAQTGTGKTLAFGLPLIERLKPGQIGLILAPTRELAAQIFETFSKLNIRAVLIIGGAPMNRQIQMLKAQPQVIIATPGRLMDHMMQRTVDLTRAGIVVLDEADRMLDMGFAPAIRKILDQTPRSRQTMLFSATMPDGIAALAASYLKNPARVEISDSGTAAENVSQELVYLPQTDKPAVLENLLREGKGTVLVFARTRHGARKLAKAVRISGHAAAELHSDRTPAQRKAALEGFKSGTFRVLVATDIAARGIDVKDIELVVNYDIPMCAEDYVHRIGRTGRAGAIGRAVTFATPEQHRDVRDIEKIIKAKLPVSRHSVIAAPKPPAHKTFGQTRQRWRN